MPSNFRQNNQETHVPYHRTRCVYEIHTPDEVVSILERAIHNQDMRVRLFYGDTDYPDFERVHGRLPELGKDWGEENMVVGYVGKSTGIKPIPLIIANSRSHGGPGILDGCIIRMLVNGREVYRHPNYHSVYDAAIVVESDLPEYSHAIISQEGEIQARFHSLKSAKNWLAFMRGNRMGK